jgi:AraC family transcriptional activator of pobA
MKKSNILLHKDEIRNIHIEIKSMNELNKAVQESHRDDHYMFIVQTKGHFVLQLDFNNVILDGPFLCFVPPGQVHKYVENRNCEGWLIFIENSLIPNQYREIFDTYLNTQQTVSVTEQDAAFKVVSMLEEVLGQDLLALKKSLIDSLTATLAGMIASKIIQSRRSVNTFSKQKHNIMAQFKLLVHDRYKTLKQVKTYASILNITPLYLNEVAKEITGFPASYWINQEVILEAKRMLHYTTLDVKRIAYELGYEDHTYFSRFFKKNVGITASEFRNNKP